jgi:hypothetical protein
MVNLREWLQDREGYILVHFIHQTLQVPKGKAPEKQDTIRSVGKSKKFIHKATFAVTFTALIPVLVILYHHRFNKMAQR